MEKPVSFASEPKENGGGNDASARSNPSQTPNNADDGNQPGLNRSIVADVSVPLEATLGYCQMQISDLLELKSGAVIELDSKLSHLVELKLNGRVIARGEIVAAKDNFALKIVEIAD